MGELVLFMLIEYSLGRAGPRTLEPERIQATVEAARASMVDCRFLGE